MISSYKLIENKVNNDLNNEISCMIKSSNKHFYQIMALIYHQFGGIELYDEHNNL